VVPDPVARIRHEPTTTFRLGWLSDLAIDANPHAVLLSLSRDCGLSGHRHSPTLTSGSSPNVYSQFCTGYHQTGGCPWLLGPRTSTTFPLPLQLIEDTARRRCRGASDLARPAVAIFICTPFEMHTSLADLGLAVCRVVTDLTPNFTFPPILDSHPHYCESC